LAVFLSRFAPPQGFVALRQAFVRRCHSATEPRVPNTSEPPGSKTLIYLKGFGAGACGANGFNEQIFGADKQVPAGVRATKNRSALQSLQLVQSGKGRIASDPALLNLPRPLMVGAFSIYGSDEQIFGADEQAFGRGQSD
jgi:hypothetical protein